jgi:hypothetical protein
MKVKDHHKPIYYIFFLYTKKNDGEFCSPLSYLSLEGIHEVWIHCHHAVYYMEFIQTKSLLSFYFKFICVYNRSIHVTVSPMLLSPPFAQNYKSSQKNVKAPLCQPCSSPFHALNADGEKSNATEETLAISAHYVKQPWIVNIPRL